MGKRNAKGIDPEAVAELRERIARMRELLRLMAPESGSKALGAVRKAFPGAPLSERVRAVNESR